MKKPQNAALLCAISALLAACGADNKSSTQAPALAAQVTQSHASGQVVHAAAEYFPTIQKIYIGYFGRPADPAGLAWFANNLASLNVATDLASINGLSSTNATVQALVDVFSNSQESQDLYAGDNSAFLDAVYRNLFNRAADPAGKAYWLDLLNKGQMTRGRAALNIMDGALTTDKDIIDMKTQIATNFTNSLDLGPEKRAYSGNSANATVRTMLGGVDNTTNPSTFQANIDATIAALVAQAPVAPQGLYHATLPGSGNTDIDMLVLDDDSYYGFYGNQQASQFVVHGFIQGQGNSNGTAFNSADMKDFGSTTPASGSLATSYSAGASINGTIQTKSGPVALSSTVVDSATYNYGAAATLSTITGAWKLMQRDGTSVDVTVNADGSLAGASGSCAFTGLLSARPAKNVFNMTITYGSGCDLANQTINGVGVTFTFNAGATRQLLLMGTTSSRSGGAFYSGTRATSTGSVAQLQKIDTQVGSGLVAAAGDNVSVNYTGYIYSAAAPGYKAAEIDASTHPITFQLGTGVVIAGWDQGLPGMQVGGHRTLIIPGSLAYGDNGTGTVVPPNQALVFDVELVSVAKT
ncbi:MAG: FKBP-type peptidyl-prolyl cis-trans isomerase [Telluria sp.]